MNSRRLRRGVGAAAAVAATLLPLTPAKLPPPPHAASTQRSICSTNGLWECTASASPSSSRLVSSRAATVQQLGVLPHCPTMWWGTAQLRRAVDPPHPALPIQPCRPHGLQLCGAGAGGTAGATALTQAHARALLEGCAVHWRLHGPQHCAQQHQPAGRVADPQPDHPVGGSETAFV